MRPSKQQIANLKPHRTGEPRTPGSGRKKGTKNHVIVAAREFCSQLVESADYQHRLRRDFTRRHVHPSMEALVWAYHLGKPRESVQVSGSLDVTTRLQAERDLIRETLDIHEIEALAAESQASLDRALANAKARRQLPQDIVVTAKSTE